MNLNNLTRSLNKILKNKNMITIVGVVVILILLYIGYSSQINNAVNPVSVPVALETIQPRTEVTSDMVTTIDMPSISVSENVFTSVNSVVGKYTNVNSVVPKGSMFYTQMLVNKDDLPNSVFYKVKDNEIAYNFPVDIESTYGNSIYPGDYVDIYMKTGDGTDEKVMLGKLIENVQILAVKDKNGKNVFENTDETSTPAMMIFGLPEDMYLLLMKANYLENLGVELYPVPHGGMVDTDTTVGTTEVSTQQLKDYIEAYSVLIDTKSESTTDELIPTVTYSNGTATIKYPEKCADSSSNYICSYSKNNSVSKTVTKTTKKIKFKKDGSLAVSVIDDSGTVHSDVYKIDYVNNKITSSLDTTTTLNGAE